MAIWSRGPLSWKMPGQRFAITEVRHLWPYIHGVRRDLDTMYTWYCGWRFWSQSQTCCTWLYMELFIRDDSDDRMTKTSSRFSEVKQLNFLIQRCFFSAAFISLDRTCCRFPKQIIEEQWIALLLAALWFVSNNKAGLAKLRVVTWVAVSFCEKHQWRTTFGLGECGWCPYDVYTSHSAHIAIKTNVL